MNNDARFFFVFFGFTGFVTLGVGSLLIHQKLTLSIIHGVIGCFIFAVAGRHLMNFGLRHQLVRNRQPILNTNATKDVEAEVAESNGSAINFTKEQPDSNIK